MIHKIVKFFLEQRLITFILLAFVLAGGYLTAPFAWEEFIVERSPVAVDAIPDLGENQQIIYTEWRGQSPQDVEDQITYPLTSSLLGLPGVKTIRSNSMYGLSSIYIIFEEGVDFYWSRTRILEKLNALPKDILPEGVSPALGPDATALGQIFWYTLEGRNPETGKANGGWSPEELRTIQDYYIKYYLSSVRGVAEVSSIGGFQKEFQVDLDPNAMKIVNVNVSEVIKAVQSANHEVGANTIEYNKVEYLVRGLGYVQSKKDIEEAVIKSIDFVPVRVKDVAVVQLGPANRRGGLDKNGVEAVGGVIVSRYGENPMKTLDNIKLKINEIASILPSKKLDDGTISQVSIVPFYDRSKLIDETLGTLESALSHEILISILVVLILVLNLRASILISMVLPIGVLITFITMKFLSIDANIVALSGIAIAIGVMVDIGIVITENIVKHFEKNTTSVGKSLDQLILNAVSEVAPAITTALATTVVSFLPVFAMQAEEGKLFHPLAFTKTIALISALVIGLIFLPTFAFVVFKIKVELKNLRSISVNSLLIILGLFFIYYYQSWISIALVLIGLNNLLKIYLGNNYKRSSKVNIFISLLSVVVLLTFEWLPLGAQESFISNLLFVVVLIGVILGGLCFVVVSYESVLRWALVNKKTFFLFPIVVLLFGLFAWRGATTLLGFLPESIQKSNFFQSLEAKFPGLGSEFMPALDEGAFLYMPTTMPHSGVEENVEIIQEIDKQINSIPEIDAVIGKWGRAESALDPAPISMFENIINYLPEYKLDEQGRKIRYKVNSEGSFILKNGGTYKYSIDPFRKFQDEELIEDENGAYFRQWRVQINSPNDIWNEIVKKANFPGLTSAPKLQPIQTRLVMLSTGMRSPMGLKIHGPDLESIEKAGFQIEKILKGVSTIDSSTVFTDRVVGKPYLEFKVDREKAARYGLNVKDVEDQLAVYTGGKKVSTAIDGRERFSIRVRYARGFRSDPEDLKNMLIFTKDKEQIPFKAIGDILYEKGPQSIKSEDSFLVSYVIFDKKEGSAEVEVVEEAQKTLDKSLKSGGLILPKGVSYKFAGNYENQIRSSKRLLIVIPISLILVFLILYFQFKTVTASLIHFSGVFVAFAGGFILIWLYNQGWFMNFQVAGTNMRDLFHIHPINMSVAVWVGFIALFGIATDDGVIMGTYIHQTFEKRKPNSVEEVRESVVIAGKKRARPAVMTAATTIIALLPVLSSNGKGADILIPMAIPVFGGMLIQILTMFIVPVLQAIWRENTIKKESEVNHG